MAPHSLTIGRNTKDTFAQDAHVAQQSFPLQICNYRYVPLSRRTSVTIETTETEEERFC